MAEQPFAVAVPDSDLELLHKKLELVRFPDELDEAGWDYGAPLADIKRLVAYWKDGFDWRAAEANINKIPQFTRDIKIDGSYRAPVPIVKIPLYHIDASIILRSLSPSIDSDRISSPPLRFWVDTVHVPV